MSEPSKIKGKNSLVGLSRLLGVVAVVFELIYFYLQKLAPASISHSYLPLYFWIPVIPCGAIGIIMGVCAFDYEERKGVTWALVINGVAVMPFVWMYLANSLRSALSVE